MVSPFLLLTMLQVFSIPESSATSTSTYSTNAGACPECKTVIDGPLNGTYGLKWENNFLCPDGCVYENDVTAQLFCFEQNGLYYVHSCPNKNTTTTTTTTTTTATVSAKSCADPKLLSPDMITCTASLEEESNYNYECEKAFDGKTFCQNARGSSEEWMQNTKIDRAVAFRPWINAEFNTSIIITKVKILSPFLENRAAKDIELLFEGDVKVDNELKKTGCIDWNEISLANHVESSSMKITINSVYGNVLGEYGFREIQIYGCY